MERSAGQAGAQALLDGSPDEPAPEAEAPDRPQSDARPLETAEWDASDAVRRASQPGAAAHQAPEDAAVEKLAALAPDGRARGAVSPQPERQLATWAQPVWEAEPYIPVAAPFAARSCAATESAASRVPEDEAQSAQLAPRFAMRYEMKPERKYAMHLESMSELIFEMDRPAQLPEARPAQAVLRAALAAPKPPEVQPLAFQPARASRPEAEQPALASAVQKPSMRMALPEQPPSQRVAVRPRACRPWPAVQASSQVGAPRAALDAPQVRPPSLSAA